MIERGKKVSVIGAGKWGRAIADLLAQHQQILLYSRSAIDKNFHDNIINTQAIDEIIDSDFLFIAIPAQALHMFCKTIQGLSSSTVLVLCSKGIDIGTGELLSNIVSREFPKNKICIFSGPNFSNEVIDKCFTVSTIASDDIDIARDIATRYSTSYFKFVPSNDIVSTQVFGALKNVLAIACGVIKSLDMGENAMAAILTIGIKEIIDVAEVFGGKSQSINSPAGIGDIFLSCNSLTSRNYNYGFQLAEGNHVDSNVVIEGAHTISALSKSHLDLVRSLPLMNFVCHLVSGDFVDTQTIRDKISQVFQGIKV